MTTALTLHAIDEPIYLGLNEYAASRKLSLNKAAKELLSKELGLFTAEDRHSELREFCGCLAADDLDQRLESLRDFDTIDEEAWK